MHRRSLGPVASAPPLCRGQEKEVYQWLLQVTLGCSPCFCLVPFLFPSHSHATSCCFCPCLQDSHCCHVFLHLPSWLWTPWPKAAGKEEDGQGPLPSSPASHQPRISRHVSQWLCHGSKESKERRLVAKAEGTACKRPRGVLDPGDSLRVEQCLWDRGGEDRERNCPASGSMLCPLPQLCPAVVG